MDAYLFDGCIVLGMADMQDIINDLFEDWVEFGSGKGSFVIPEIVRGQFFGYVDKDGNPIGKFFAENGRVFVGKQDTVSEVTIRLVKVI